MRTRQPVLYWSGFSIILVLLIVAPLILPEFWRRFLTEILIWGLLAMSSDLLIGFTGLVMTAGMMHFTNLGAGCCQHRSAKTDQLSDQKDRKKHRGD